MIALVMVVSNFSEAIKNRYRNFLGIQSIPVKARNLLNKYLILIIIFSFVGSLSNTFIVLFYIDRVGFAFSGVILSIMFTVQLITDYPSGSLGDWVGQRTILSISFLCFAIGYIILSTAVALVSYMIAAVLFGLAFAQASGTLGTWLDNNYKIAMAEEDPDRKTYGFCLARIGSIIRFVNASAFIVGGILATTISRQFVFLIQAALFLPTILLILKFLVNIQSTDKQNEPQKKTSMRDYFKFLKGGVKFLVSNRKVFFFLMGTGFMMASFQIWGSLFLFPIYFGYTGTDSLASILRSSIFLIGIPISIIISRISTKTSIDKLTKIYLPTFLIFYPSFMILLILNPITNSMNLIGIIGTIAILVITVDFLFSTGEILRG
ncbi:MAG: MFS transporter, partial [Candidatus Ranarchaeia archaeon]